MHDEQPPTTNYVLLKDILPFEESSEEDVLFSLEEWLTRPD